MGSLLSSKDHRMDPEMAVTELQSTLSAAAGIMRERKVVDYYFFF